MAGLSISPRHRPIRDRTCDRRSGTSRRPLASLRQGRVVELGNDFVQFDGHHLPAAMTDEDYVETLLVRPSCPWEA